MIRYLAMGVLSWCAVAPALAGSAALHSGKYEGLMLAVTLERWLAKMWMSLPILYVGAGFLLASLPLGLPFFNPAWDGFDALTLEYVTEFIVIASLAAAGIAIDRPVSWRNWRQIWPLLVVAMPLTIAAVAFLGWWAIGLAPASAILLGAALAPTDPVLARSVQVGPPGEGKRHDVRFSLTVEAGINDGLAFPFTHLAIAALGMSALGSWTLEWAAFDLVYRIVAGVAAGWGIGRLGAWYVFEREADAPIEEVEDSTPKYSTREGLVVLGTLLLAYGSAELIHGYGFLAVFVAAVTARQRENASRYHKISHHFIDQIEQIVLVAVLLGFGAMLASGVLNALTWPAALVGLALVPITGLLFAAIGLVFTMHIRIIDLYSFYFTLFLTPLFLFSGVFFPLEERLSGVWLWVAEILPLLHPVRIARACNELHTLPARGRITAVEGRQNWPTPKPTT